MIAVAIAKLRALAEVRPAGLLEDWTARGKIEGGWLLLDEADHLALIKKYRPGAGDKIARVLRRLGFSSCDGCAARQARLNEWLPD